MIVGENEAAFAHLEWFAQTFDSKERRAKRFLEDLQPELRLKVMVCRCQTVAEMDEMASRFEDEYKKYMEDHPKGKSKTSFASRFSSLVCRVPVVLVALVREGRRSLVVLLVAGIVLQAGVTLVLVGQVPVGQGKDLVSSVVK